MSDTTCGTCGYPLELVRPGKHQCRVCEAEAEIERLRAEVEHWKQARNDAISGGEILKDALNAERQRARLPKELVAKIRKARVGSQCPTWASILFREILAWHEQEMSNE